MTRPAPDTLSQELRARVVRIRAGTSVGTGVVISANLVLTCRHVVLPAGAGGQVTVTGQDGNPLVGVVEQAWPGLGAPEAPGTFPYPDVAVVRIETVNELPAVLLDDSPVKLGDRVFVFGWAADSLVGGQSKWFEVVSTDDGDGRGQTFVRISDEAAVPGMSGSPVCTADGFVVGLLSISRGPQTGLGGWVVPVQRFLPLAPELQAPFEDPGPRVQSWLSLLSGLTLKDRGRDRDGRKLQRSSSATTVDLSLSRLAGDPPARWKVHALNREDCHAEVSEVDLGAGVFKAVSRWSRRQNTMSREDVGILGDLLGRAIGPPPVTDLIEQTAAQGHPLVRVRMDGRDDLADVPWEFARIGGKPIATREDLTFTRFVELGREVWHPPPLDTIRVLLVVVGVYRGKRVDLDRDMIAASVGANVRDTVARNARISVEVCRERSFSEMGDQYGRSAWDVVHYIGPVADRPDLLSFPYGPEDATGTRQDTDPVDLVEFAGFADRTGARLLVIERVVDTGRVRSVDRVPTDVVRAVLDGSVRALVLAEHPANSRYTIKLCEHFYAALNRGDPAERAVQATRRQLALSPTDSDHSAFGLVTVTTGQRGDVPVLTALTTELAAGQRTGPARALGPSVYPPSGTARGDDPVAASAPWRGGGQP